MLLFTPELCSPPGDPWTVLERALPYVDVVQVRVKDRASGQGQARGALDWSLRVHRHLARTEPRALVLVNDRVDVAAALAEHGIDGVHLGTDDSPPELARALLGPEALIGLSTHSPADVAAAEELPVDYLGFGPVHPTATKGYARGLGSEAAWIAARACSRPLFPVGGIDATNAAELTEVGRAAVGRAILAAPDPAEAARAIALLLASGE
jgi:thiamine-phosphate diphosphorylase